MGVVDHFKSAKKKLCFFFFSLFIVNFTKPMKVFKKRWNNGSRVVGNVKYLVLFCGVLDSGFVDFLWSIRGLLYSSV
jgi:hypothetical protein